MIWLASFPRSGNTFFRNVLYEVYGIQSGSYHQDPDRKLKPDFAQNKVIKTHLLPHQLPAELRDAPSVYIIRDGRDALVSIAHHRKDIVAAGSDFYNNLLEAIIAQGGSFFGGWSENVAQWTQKADIIIRFEDLIKDPIHEIEKLRSIIDLPAPNLSKLPNFKSLKFGQPKYGAGEDAKFKNIRPKLHFRKGKVGGWKEELPKNLESLLWTKHGAILQKWGFEKSNIDQDSKTQKHILIEASKYYSNDNDGIKRYLTELVNGLSIILPYFPEWQVELYGHKSIQPIITPAKESISTPDLPDTEFRSMDEKEVILKDRRTMGYEKWLLLTKNLIKQNLPSPIYNKVSDFYKKGPFRKYLTQAQLQVRRNLYKKNDTEILASLKGADLIHIPLPQHMAEIGEINVPLLVTVHDITHQQFPAFHTKRNIELAENGMQAIVEKNAHVLSVSKSTSKDVQEIYKIDQQRIHLCYEAANTNIFNPAKRQESIQWLKKKYKLPDTPYFMCLSTIEPRKNLKNTILAFLKLKKEHPEWPISLLVCGKKGWKTNEVFKDMNIDNPAIIFTGFVDDAHLPYLYAHARALCYISHYEGFGLPLLEAMSCKTPVIYGNNSSMPEVAGDGGLAADSNNISDIKEKLFQLLSDEQLWQEKSEAAFRQASTFSWLKTAMQTLDIYNKVIEANQ